MRLWSTVIYSVLSILSCVHLPPWFHNHEPPICCGVWRAKLVLVCYRPLKATLNEAVMDQDGWPIKHCRSMWAVRIADSLMMSAASWSVYEEIYGRRPPSACSLECLYYVFWSWRPNGIPRWGALACIAAPQKPFSNSVRKRENDTLLSECFVSAISRDISDQTQLV